MHYIIEGITKRFDTQEEAKDWALAERGIHYPRILEVDAGQLLEQIVGVLENLTDNHKDYDLQKTLQTMLSELKPYGIISPEDLQNPFWDPVASDDWFSLAERTRRDEAALRAWNRMAEETA